MAKRITSNRTIRRAAERAALKAARKAQRQSTPTPVNAPATKAMAATASILPGDDQATYNHTIDNTITDKVETMTTEETHQSTGPRTEAGKQASSRNSTKHGLCAVKTLILPSESITDYLILESNWFQTYQADPFYDNADPIKAELIRTAARADWFFKRAERNYSDVDASLFAETPSMSDWTDDQHKKLSRALRYRTANANILAKHRKDLESHIKARASERAQHLKSRDNEERMSMARERLEIFREKNKPFDLAAELIAMKEKAIRLGFREPDPEPAAE